ncbi:MAG: RNA 2',3'-cyclic phosphodiesterase [Chloroflexota bacterium]
MTQSGRRPRWPGADLPGRRLFYAVPIPSEATDEIAALVERVRAEGVPGGGRDVRWVRLDGLHLTLRFLGPTLDDRIEAATEALRAAVAGQPPFDVAVGGAGTFPPGRRPRALWLDIRAGEAELSGLAGSVDRALAAHGWDIDPKPFRPHLTLARSDGVPAGAAIGARLMAAAETMDVRFRAERIGLYESMTGGGPARYEPLAAVDLA